MPYLIDSDLVILHLGRVPGVVDLLSKLATDGIAVSVIRYMEALEGVQRSADPVIAQGQFDAFLRAVPVVSISRPIAERCADVRQTLRQQGRRVRSRALDLLIAATALEYGLTLVTRNVDDYRDIPGLTIYQPT